MRIFRSPQEAESAPEARSGRRSLAVAALTLGLAAMIGGLLSVEIDAPHPRPVAIAEAPELTKMQLRGEDMLPPSGDAVATFQGDGRAPPLIPVGGPAQRKNVNAPALVVFGAIVPEPAKAAQPGHEKSGESPTTVDPPAKDASPLAMTPPSATGPALTARSGDAEKPGGSPASYAPNQMDRSIDPAAFRPDPSTNPSGKWTARVAVAAADTAAPAPAAETAVRPVAHAKWRPAASQQARAPHPSADSRATPAPAEQVANPLSRAFVDLINSLTRPAVSVRPRDPAPNSTSGGWVVQLGASGSESEARSEAVRLGARYASALHGAPIGLNKAWARGGTVYRLRAIGLSEADATALCAQVRGDGGGCFYGK